MVSMIKEKDCSTLAVRPREFSSAFGFKNVTYFMNFNVASFLKWQNKKNVSFIVTTSRLIEISSFSFI